MVTPHYPGGRIFIPGISALTFVTLSLLPRISPKNFTMNDFVGSYQKVIFALVAFLFVIHCIMLWSVISPMANEATISTSILGQWLPVCLGVLFTVIGNFLNKTKRNFFFGIRTPWTLADSEVWARTHRVGGWMFLLAGISCILAGLLVPHPYAMGVVLASIISTVIGATLYSFILYRRIHTPA